MVIGDEHKKDSREKCTEEIANAGATPQGNRNAPQVQAAANYQVLVKPLAITDGEVRETLFQMAHAITTQAQAITTQANMEVAPRENQHARTMASRLRDFMRMNPHIFLISKVEEDPKSFLMRCIR